MTKLSVCKEYKSIMDNIVKYIIKEFAKTKKTAIIIQWNASGSDKL